MFSLIKCLISSVLLLIYTSKTCNGDIPSPSLTLYMPGEPEWTEVLVRRVNDNLTLVCELKGDNTKRRYVWNFVAENATNDRPFKVTPSGPTNSSTLFKDQLQEWDSGHYMCSAPPFSVTKFILVQDRGPKICGRGTFWCGQRCMAAQYVCDGRLDCLNGEDEAAPMCSQNVCGRPDKLNCSTGRCISSSACCRRPGPLCQQPSCCEEYPMFSRLEASYVEEYPPLFEDRHAPDDYGFIQSTIYTVTACALIFMLAVVLLVSAICKMHMKRAALRSYAHAERATRQHYTMQYEQTHRFPPSYDAFRLLESESRPPASPVRDTPLQCNSECPAETPECPNDCASPGTDPRNAGFGLARLSAIFSSRYRQVPTQSDVELTHVRSSSLNNSPTRNRTLDNYRSPTYCDLNTSEFYFTNPETADLGRDLNYMAPVDLMRNRNNSIERVIDQFDRQRLTLQLGRFQLTIPRFGRRNDSDRRPDTPNVAEINIDDLDFVRMTSHETYTLNGRTIRLLGANFENYPLSPNGTRPPPYNEAMRCKFFGPPPEYLSREGLNSRADEDARTNVEMPPCYDELNGENPVASSSRNGEITAVTVPTNNNNGITVASSSNEPITEGITVTSNNNGLSDRSPTVTSRNNGLTRPITVTTNSDGLTRPITVTSNNNNEITDRSMSVASNNNGNDTVVNNNVISPVITVTDIDDSNSNNNVQSLSSIINNLPAIDSDVNANDTAINC